MLGAGGREWAVVATWGWYGSHVLCWLLAGPCVDRTPCARLAASCTAPHFAPLSLSPPWHLLSLFASPAPTVLLPHTALTHPHTHTPTALAPSPFAGGMGCSAGMIAVDLAAKMLRVGGWVAWWVLGSVVGAGLETGSGASGQAAC